MLKGRSFLVKMVKDGPSGAEEEVDMTDEIKSHFEKYKAVYISGGILTIVGITCLVTKSASGPHVDREISQVAKNGIAVNAKNVVMRNVSVIAANRQGPPSWVIRCVETGDIFASQGAAADAMNISRTAISQQLNGLREHAQDFHFERICMAA